MQLLCDCNLAKWVHGSSNNDSEVEVMFFKQTIALGWDFIVCFSDGRTGLFDTKSGFTIGIAKDKSDGLIAYINTENKHRDNKHRDKDKPLIGGIVTQADGRGEWKIYNGTGVNLNPADLSNWNSLDW